MRSTWAVAALLAIGVGGCSEPQASPGVVTPVVSITAAVTPSASSKAAVPSSPSARATQSAIGWNWGSENARPCAIQAGGELTCWSLDDDCRLQSPTQPIAERVVSIASGARHTCVLLSDGRVFCWGANADQQLGSFETADTQPVALAGPAASVSAGFDHTCAVLEDGRTQCWGDNSSGQLGIEAIPFEEAPRHRPADPKRLVNVAPLVDIAAGGGHTCGLLASGELRCWGDSRGSKIDAALSLEQTLRTAVALAAPATRVVTGTWTNCAVLTDGRVQCWGENEYGHLCHGGPPSSDPVTIPLPGKAIAVAVSEREACAVLENGNLACWGGTCQAGSCGGAPSGGTEPCSPRIRSGRFREVASSFRATCTLDRLGHVACSCHR